MTRGKFIVLEGLDRSGKSTQVERLVKKLDAKLQKFPDRSTAIGGMINEYLQSKADMDDHAIHLLFSANRWEVAKQIEEEIAAGTTIVADRYAFSGIAFSAAKGLAFDYCAQPDSGLPLPDLVLYLTLSPEAAAARGQYGEERYENVDMQQRTREKFAMVGYEMDRAHPGRWAEIDADGTIDEVEARIWEKVKGLEIGEEGLGKLWSI